MWAHLQLLGEVEGGGQGMLGALRCTLIVRCLR